ncbi:hypothetical protein JCM21900_000228 [Sporobolomyces salmonicolor]
MAAPSSSLVERRPPLKNVVVVGGSYIGLATADELIKTLPPTHRVIVLERNSHFNHLFAYPRFAIAPKHEHKAFIPFHPMLRAPHSIVRVTAVSLSATSVSLDRPVTLSSEQVTEIEYDALVLATGTKLSPPGTIPGDGDKKSGVEYLQGIQGELKEAKDVVILGGGAVGVQMACDLATLYPGQKSITLIHSRQHLMPRFHPLLSEIVLKRFAELGVKTVLGCRAKVPEGGFEGWKAGDEVETLDGRSVKADYVITSTGQTPNSDLLRNVAPSAILPNGFVSVTPSFVVTPSNTAEQLGGKVFAVGDIAESGTLKAARPAVAHAAIVAGNIAKLLEGKSADSYETSTPYLAGIRLGLGIRHSVSFMNPPSRVDESTGEVEWLAEPEVDWNDEGTEDMGIERVWERMVPGFATAEESYYL